MASSDCWWAPKCCRRLPLIWQQSQWRGTTQSEQTGLCNKKFLQLLKRISIRSLLVSKIYHKCFQGMLPTETQWKRWFCFLWMDSLIFEMAMMVHFHGEEINVSVTGLYNCICFSGIYSPSSACETTATSWQRKLSEVTMPPGRDTLNHIWISPWQVWYTDQRQEHRCKIP